MTPRFRIKILSGKLQFANLESFKQHLLTLDGEYYLSLERPKKQRSLNQNSYYWGVVIPIAGEHFGYENQEMHEVFKFQYLLVNDGRFKRVKSTTELDTVGFVEYVDKIKAFCATEGCYIPDPNEINVPQEYEVFD